MKIRQAKKILMQSGINLWFEKWGFVCGWKHRERGRLTKALTRMKKSRRWKYDWLHNPDAMEPIDTDSPSHDNSATTPSWAS